MKKTLSLQQAYDFCQRMAESHYENFPVASLLLPKRLRRPISVIYAFARTADDFADEGNTPQATRLAQLNAYSDRLTQLQQQQDNPIFIALADVIEQFNLPTQLFEDLLIAFRQDVVKSRYANFAEVLNYCVYSANPVGRLLLLLDGSPTEQQLQQSDAICSALQLINFYQDIEQDYTEQDRIYIPQDELAKAGLQERDLIQPDTQKIAPLIRSLYLRTQQLMRQGYELGSTIDGRLGWEIRAMTLGGITTLNMLLKQNDAHLLTRPRLSKLQLLKIMLISANKSYYHHVARRLLQPA